MSDKTGIEWTDATWNPIRGCSRISEGCRNCYAERVAHRFSGTGQPYEDLVDKHGRWNGTVRLIDSALKHPLHWKAPRRIFVNSMSDLFHDALTDEQIAMVFGVMAKASWHTFQILTKRPERMARWFEWAAGGRHVWPAAQSFRMPAWALREGLGGDGTWPLPNVWLGVSVENQAAADERIRPLLRTPAAVRFLSCEPLLGPIDLQMCSYGPYDGRMSQLRSNALHWVIAGGESGSAARPTSPDWFRGLRDQCVGADVPFFFKQWGEWAPEGTSGRPEGDRLRRVGKKAAGALLDGERWQQFPPGGLSEAAGNVATSAPQSSGEPSRESVEPGQAGAVGGVTQAPSGGGGGS